MALSVSCPHCGARFALPDEVYERKVKGRKVTLRCKQCNGEIQVDGTEREDEATIPSSRRASAHPPVAGLWVVSYADDDDRELTLAQLENAIVQREITDSTLVWREGMPEWQALGAVEELALLVLRAKAQSGTPPSKPEKPKPKKPPLPKTAKAKRGEAGPFKSLDAGTFSVGQEPAAVDVGRVSTTPELSALTAGLTPPPKPEPIDEEILKLGATNVGSLDGPPTIDVSDLTAPRPARREAAPPKHRSTSWPWIVIVVAALLAMWWLVIRPLTSRTPTPNASPSSAPSREPQKHGD
jgi:hypothetical protein